MKNDNLPVLSVNSGDALSIAQEAVPVYGPEEQPGNSGMGIHDVLFMLFRHKRKIIVFALAGILAAGVIYLVVPPNYESEAKLLVRYVVEHNAVDGLDPMVKTPTPENHTLLNSEVEILTSSDLIRQVAESVGINRLALGPLDDATKEKAVEFIDTNLEVSVVKDTNIISVAFISSDPDLPMPIVQEVVKRYFDKHLEVHRSTGAFDFVARETADLKKELAKTEAELKVLRERGGIISLAGAKADLATELGKTQQELDSAESDLAGQQARVKDLVKALALPETPLPESQVQPISGDMVEKYRALLAQLTQLQKAQTELLLKFTPSSPLVRVKTAQIEDLEKRRADLEKEYPALVNTAKSETSGARSPGPPSKLE
jgi:uncharacterized protein involved in exopolysaccharide biosynthesis